MAKSKPVGVHGTDAERAGGSPRGAKKTECPITRQQFTEEGKPVTVTVEGKDYLLDMKEFSTGSLGWGSSDKAVMKVGGTPVKVQVSINLTIIGSKELPPREKGEDVTPDQ